MLQNEQQRAAEQINTVLDELGYGRREFEMRPIPFSGVWGTSSTVAYQLANDAVNAEADGALADLSKKERKRRTKELVGQRAQSIAEAVAAKLEESGEFGGVEATNGYINIVFDANRFANRVVSTIHDANADFGRGMEKADRVMVEFSQPNTHKAFHIGHMRNVALGNALCRIMDFAGFEVLRANYIGDIGMHVIKCLWCYDQFHRGEEPPAEERGLWLGQIYTESDQRLNYRKDVVGLLNELAETDPIFVEMVDRMMKALWTTHKSGEDVAYLLGQIANKREIKADAFYEPDTIEKFWPVVGAQLEQNRTKVIEGDVEEPAGDENAIPSVAQYDEWLERWAMLNERLTWWPHVPQWEQEVRETFQRWERKDPAFVELWEETKSWSMQEFMRIYDELDVPFDVWFYESEVEEEGREIVRDLLEQGIAEVSDGLPVVKIDEQLGLEKETYRTLPILRSDGTTLYSTKDLALTREKFQKYGVDRAVWVVDVRQGLYFQQVFKVMELLGFEQAQKCFHLGYEMVTLPTGAMSSRSGNFVLYQDVADSVLARAREIIDEKNPTLDEADKQRISHQVGVGSLKYGMLFRDNNRVIVFDIEEALSFEGHAAPYIQYAHARACRILEKVDTPVGQDLNFSKLMAEEIDLIQQIAVFPSEIERAAFEHKPLIIATYVYELAKRFNEFYRACPVLQADEPQRSARLALVSSARQVLANGLGVLGIHAPDTM